jgi:hypothetical protein
MSKYQQKLHDLYEFTPVKTGNIIPYHNFYIHSVTFKGNVTIHCVRLIGCACYYSKSIVQVKKRIRAFKKSFNL